MNGSSKPKKTKPTIRIIRNMARSGGTLLGKCIGSMDPVVLLSEIHPGDLRSTNPMHQARDWFGLVGAKDMMRWKVRAPSLLQFVSLCDTRARGKGRTLVLRDWSHLDYIGVPFVEPGYGFALGESLEAAYELRVSVTTRHPLDQYLSLSQLWAVAPHVDFDKYCHGCLRFAEYASGHGFHRYEDFTADPDGILGEICRELDLEFDPSYRQRWHQYKTITGDTEPGLGRGSTKREIVPMPRKEVEPALLERFRGNDEYLRACSLLGYDP